MALKKKTPPTSSTVTSTATKERKPIAPPARKPIAPPVKKAPVVRAPEPPKEVKRDEPKKIVKKAPVQPPVKREEPKSPEAPKPVVPAGGEARKPEPRRVDTPERLPIEVIRNMELEDRYKLFRSLNKDPEKFIPMRSDVPKQMQMRKDEAIIRNIVPDKAPKSKLTVLYCPYCVDWQVFHFHAFTGYNKCCGCTISTKDFYVAIDNGIFGKV